MVYVRFDHEIEFSAAAYDQAVARYKRPSKSFEYGAEIKPHFYDRYSTKTRCAGIIELVTATPESFTGSWFITDDPDSANNKAYEDLLEQCGIPKSTEYSSYAFSQHLVGGERIDDKIFAVTSIFRVNALKRRGCILSKEKLEKVTKIHNGLFEGDIPHRDDFDYSDFKKLATAVGGKRAR